MNHEAEPPEPDLEPTEAPEPESELKTEEEEKTDEPEPECELWGNGEPRKTESGKDLHESGFTIVNLNLDENKLAEFRDLAKQRFHRAMNTGNVHSIGKVDSERFTMKVHGKDPFLKHVVQKVKLTLGMNMDENVKEIMQEPSHTMHNPTLIVSGEKCSAQSFHVDNSIRTADAFTNSHAPFNLIVAIGKDVTIDLLEKGGELVRYRRLVKEKRKYGWMKKMLEGCKRKTVRVPKGHAIIFRHDFVHAGSRFHGQDNYRMHVYFQPTRFLTGRNVRLAENQNTYYLDGSIDEWIMETYGVGKEELDDVVF